MLKEMSDEVAQCWTANPMCSACVGSNSILVVSIIIFLATALCRPVYAKRFAAMVNIRFSLLLQIVVQIIFQISILLKMTTPLLVN